MKLLKIGEMNSWYYGCTGDLLPITDITLDLKCDGEPQILISTFDGDKKPKCPFGDEYSAYLCEMDVEFLDIDENNVKQSLIEMINLKEYDNAMSLLGMIKTGFITL